MLSADELKILLSGLSRPLVALSGGLDSSLLALLVFETKKKDMLAVTADSPSLSAPERKNVENLTAKFSLPHIFIRTSELENSRYTVNGRDRCYHCKHELFSKMRQLAGERNFRELLYGAQTEDLNDYRPGFRAAQSFSVRAPFIEAGWSKQEIRAEAKRRGLDFYNRPASPCLASRIAYGIPVSEERLRRIEKAEEILRKKGLAVFRVRDWGNYATIELVKTEENFLSGKPAIIEEIKQLGFERVSFDPRGYRQGSLNEEKRID